MTLNFSHRPIFPVNPSEENLVSSIRVGNGYFMEGISEKNRDGYGINRHYNWDYDYDYDYESSYDSGRDRADRGGSRDSISQDILDFLPSDPFEMNVPASSSDHYDVNIATASYPFDMSITAASFTAAIAELFEDFETDGLNFIWNGAMKVQIDPCNMGNNGGLIPSGGFDCKAEEFLSSFDSDDTRLRSHEKESGEGTSGDGCNVKEFLSFGNEDTRGGDHRKESEESTSSCSAEDGVPHEALLFSLSYLSVQDLLSAEMVCRSLRSAVQSDAFVRRCIHIDKPFSDRLTDDSLLHLVRRTQGNLQCLSLMHCTKITDNGLRQVLDCCPRLTRLNVLGCSKMSNDGLVDNLKMFNSSNIPGIRQIKIGLRYDFTPMHFEMLKSIVGADKLMHPNVRKPRFHRSGQVSLPCDDDCAIDIEMCPLCEHLRILFDCPVENCQGKQLGTQLCRACINCIMRCSKCGRCVNDSVYEETFYFESLCSDCLDQPSPLQEEEEGNDGHHINFHG